jgi:hypothetical protein
MTQTESPAIEIVAIAATIDGFSIAILRGRWNEDFAIARVNVKNQFVVLHTTPDRNEARRLAKSEWRWDTGRER